jgi:glycosyltransferase involved in cell wall biosynthesis
LQRFSGGFAKALQDFGVPDLVHDHGIWLSFHRVIARACAKHGIPRLVSPRGMLEPWALNHKKWKKRLAWWLYQHRDLVSATALHATAEPEAGQLRALGFRQPILVLPNGVDVPPSSVAAGSGGGSHALPPVAPDQRSCAPRRQTALFLSRIHPIKGLPMLFEAWARLKPADWRIRVVGPDEGGHLADLQRLCGKLGLAWQEEGGRGNPACNILFSPALEGPEKWAAFRDADLFVLPTHSENFGIAVAEAMAHGLPVITTHGAPWKLLEEEQCGWWVPVSVDGIAAALDDATRRSPEELAAMGERGRAVVVERFSWDKIAADMVACYEWLLGRGAKPDCVRQC